MTAIIRSVIIGYYCYYYWVTWTACLVGACPEIQIERIKQESGAHGSGEPGEEYNWEDRVRMCWPPPDVLAQRHRAANKAAHHRKSRTHEELIEEKKSEAMHALPKSVVQTLLNWTADSGADIGDQDLDQLDIGALLLFQDDFRRMLNGSQVERLVASFVNRSLHRQAAIVLERLGGVLTEPQVTLLLTQQLNSVGAAKRCNAEVQAVVRSALALLEPVEDWNETVAARYDPVIMKAMPADMLMAIRDPALSAALWPMIGAQFGCDFWRLGHTVLQLMLFTNAHGPASGWSSQVIGQLPPSLLGSLTIKDLLSIPGSTLVQSSSAFTKIAPLTRLSQNRVGWDVSQGYLLVRKLLQHGVSQWRSVDAFRSYFVYTLHYLAPFFMIRFLPDSVNGSAALSFMDVVSDYNNLRAFIPRASAEEIVQFRIRNLDPSARNPPLMFNRSVLPFNDLFKAVPRNLWAAAIASGYVDRNRLDAIAGVDAIGGYIPDGEVKRLSLMAMRIYGDLASTPALYWSGGVAVKKLESIADFRKDWRIVNKIRIASDSFNNAQLATIYYKLLNGGSAVTNWSRPDFGPVLMSMLPSSVLDAIDISDLRYLAGQSLPDSAITLVYTKKLVELKQQAAAVIDFVQDPILISVLHPQHVTNISDQEVPILLSAVRAAPYGPPLQTIESLKYVLDRLTSLGDADNVDDVSVLNSLCSSDVEVTVPATVLAAFNSESLQSVPEGRKKAILKSVGALGVLEYYKIPREKRLLILRQGLDAMTKMADAELDQLDMVIVGTAIVDLPAEAILRLNPAALEYSLPQLQGSVDVFPDLQVRPCLDQDQRNAIRQAIISSYGNTSSWDFDVIATLCCSLDTLSEAELDSIPDRVILECDCAVDDPTALHLKSAQQSHKATCEFEVGAQLGGLVAGSKLVMLRKSRAALRIYQNDMVVVERINEAGFVSDEDVNVTCDAVMATRSGAAGFTSDQLRSLRESDVVGCMYDLGSAPLTQDQATAIWQRILQVYGSASKIPKNQLMQLGWIVVGIDPASVRKMTLSDPNLIGVLGNNAYPLSPHQLEALASEVLRDWKSAESYTAKDLITLGRILCAMDAVSIEHIKDVEYAQASVMVGSLTQCPYSVLTQFATKAVAQFGDPGTWSSDVVRSVGTVVGGLSAEQLRSIPPKAMRGLTVSAVASVTTNNFKALTTHQIQSLPIGVARRVYVSAEQRSQLVPEMTAALESVLGKGGERNYANYPNAGAAFVVALLVAILVVNYC